MLQRGDKYIAYGVLLTVKSAKIDDHYVYVSWDKIGFMKIPIKRFFQKYISVTSMLNIDYFKNKDKYHNKYHNNFQLTI